MDTPAVPQPQQTSEASAVLPRQDSGQAIPPSAPPPPPAPPKQNGLPAWIPWSIAAALVTLLAVAGIVLYPRIAFPDELTIVNQIVTEGSIRVENLRIISPKGGFLVIYRLVNTDLYGSAIATSFYLYPETYTDFTFPVKPEVDAKLLAGNLFMGVLYEDSDESKNWEPQIDQEVKTLFGKQVKSLFRDLTPPETVIP